VEIVDGVEIVDLALYLKKSRVLVISDIHIGYEESLNKQGVFVPRFQFSEVVRRLESILKRVHPKMIVINGDVKHEFGEISDQEWRETLKVLDMLSKVAPVTLVKGNHDTILGPIARKREIAVKPYAAIDEFFIVHGHKLVDIPESATTVIIGHEHPAVALREHARSETYKCFLLGKYHGRKLIVQPSFNLVVEGTDVLQEELLSPFLKQNMGNFEVHVVSDSQKHNILYFGRLKGLN
jgi:putative SbcD/Mre11-related phosphoesterase